MVVASNKKVVETYMDGISRLDLSAISSCLTEDVEWLEWATGFPSSGVPLRGRTAFIHNVDRPADVTLRTEITRMTEENDVVVAEGTVA